MLPKKNWREQILPRMSVELGIFPPTTPARAKANSFARAGSTRMRLASQELWPKIEGSLYLRTAPDRPLPQPDHPPIELG